MTPQIPPINPRASSRISRDSVWPLKLEDGRTFAERASGAPAPTDKERK